jgi:hypothetical protein
MPPKKTKAKSDEPGTNTMDLTEKVQALVMEASAVRKPHWRFRRWVINPKVWVINPK